MSSLKRHEDGETQTGPQPANPLLERQIRRLIATFNLTQISRRAWLTTALALLGVASTVAIWQLHWNSKWHEPRTPLSLGWWAHPIESNPEAALPQFNRRLETVALQPSQNRVWVAGEAGFISVGDNDGRDWSELKYDYDVSTGNLRKSAAPELPGGGASTALGRLRLPALVPSVSAGQPPAGVVASPQEVAFTERGQRQTVTITNQTRSQAYPNSITTDPPSLFAVEQACKVIGPGQQCSVSVQFMPPGPGSYKGRLVVNVTLQAGSTSSAATLYVALIGSSVSNPKTDFTQQSRPAEASQETQPGPKQSNPPADNPKTLPAQPAQSKSGPTPDATRTPASQKQVQIASAEKKQPVVDRSLKTVAASSTPVTPSAPWKPPSRLGTILAMEWTSANAARMVTDDAVIYSTADGGDTWQAQPWNIPGDAAKEHISIGEKDLGRRIESGRARAIVVGKRIPEPTLSALGTDKVVAIARNPASSAVWLIAKFSADTAPTLLRSPNGARFFSASHTGDQGVYWLLPAPWYWLLALPLVLLAAAAAAFAGNEEHKVQESVSNIGIPDRPLKPGEPDAMNLNALAQGLSLFLRNESTKPPLVLAVNGNWGTGKSSLMNLLQQDLKRRGARAVWFNAWHHQKEQQLLAALLQTVRKDAVPPWWTALGFWLRTKLLVKRGRKMWWAFAILFAAGAFLVSLALDIHNAHVGLLWKYTDLWLDAYKGYVKEGVIPSWLKHAPLYTSILGVLYALNGVRKSATAFGANPASLLASFSGFGRIKDLEAQTSFRQQFSAQFRQVVEVLGSHRLLIVIDDLDRCRPEKVREVLETVNFLVSSADCFVILGLARGIVEHCVGLSFSTVVDTMPAEMLGLPPDAELKTEKKREIFARRYLDKLVQMEVSLPQLTEQQARTLLGAESASLLTDESRRKTAEEKRRRKKIENRVRAVFEWTGRWLVPAAVCVSLAVGLWQIAHPLAGPLAVRIERQLNAREGNQKSAATAGAAPAASPQTTASATPSAAAAPAVPGTAIGSPPRTPGLVCDLDRLHNRKAGFNPGRHCWCCYGCCGSSSPRLNAVWIWSPKILRSSAPRWISGHRW